MWPVLLAVAVPFVLAAPVLYRQWQYGAAALIKRGQDLADPDDLTLTKLRLNDPDLRSAGPFPKDRA